MNELLGNDTFLQFCVESHHLTSSLYKRGSPPIKIRVSISVKRNLDHGNFFVSHEFFFGGEGTYGSMGERLLTGKEMSQRKQHHQRSYTRAENHGAHFTACMLNCPCLPGMKPN